MKKTFILAAFLLISTSLRAQPPVIDSMLIDESKGVLSVYGDFGNTQGKLWCDSVELPVVSWSAALITATIPDTGKGSAGGVVVGARGDQSNKRMVTKWTGTAKTMTREYTTGTGYYHNSTVIYFSFRADLHSMLIHHSIHSLYMPLAMDSKLQLNIDESIYDNPDRFRDESSCATIVPIFRPNIPYDSGFVGTGYPEFNSYRVNFHASNGLGFVSYHHKTVRENGHPKEYYDTSKSTVDNADCDCEFDSLYNVIEKYSLGRLCKQSEVVGIPPPKAFALQFNPSIIAIKSGSTNIGTDDAVLRWDSLKLMEKYRLQVSKDSIVNSAHKSGQSPQSVTFVVDTVIPSLDFKLPPLEKNTKYYWRVAGVNSEGQSNWSEQWNFTTGTSADVRGSRRSNISLSIYPNPSAKESTITFTTPKRGRARLIVYDMTGRVVSTLFDAMSDGKREISLDASQFAAGSYIVGLVCGKDQVSRTFQIVK